MKWLHYCRVSQTREQKLSADKNVLESLPYNELQVDFIECPLSVLLPYFVNFNGEMWNV